jgi:hypothetical protein
MVGEPSHVKQLSLNHVCKIGLNSESSEAMRTCLMVKIFIANRSKHVHIKEFKF